MQSARPRSRRPSAHVPRHLFLPGVPLDQAYADEPVYTKTDDGGASISAASQPWIVAMMLEQLDAQPGHRVLEVGAGTGYNAALLAAIVGDTGQVTTIDVDEDLVDGARKHLAAAGVTNVDVAARRRRARPPRRGTVRPDHRHRRRLGDTRPRGWTSSPPAGAWSSRCACAAPPPARIIFERDPNGWVSRGSELAVFMPLRGIGDDARRIVALTDERTSPCRSTRTRRRRRAPWPASCAPTACEAWTGVLFPPMVPFEWMDLWLCLPTGQPPHAHERPTRRGRTRTGHAHVRVGIDGHGRTAQTWPTSPSAPHRPPPTAASATRSASSATAPAGQRSPRRWARRSRPGTRPTAPAPCASPSPTRPAADPAAGRFVLPRPHHPITVTWE